MADWENRNLTKLQTSVPLPVYEKFLAAATNQKVSSAALLRRLVLDFLGLDIGRPEQTRWFVRSKNSGAVCHISENREAAQHWSDKFLQEHGEVVPSD